MSGCNYEKDLQQLLSLGLEAFLKKPFKVDDLTKALRPVMDDLQQLLSLGLEAFLKKPFKVDDLTKALRPVMDTCA